VVDWGRYVSRLHRGPNCSLAQAVWPHNAPRNRKHVPVSYHYRDCQVPHVVLFLNLSSAIASTRNFTSAVHDDVTSLNDVNVLEVSIVHNVQYRGIFEDIGIGIGIPCLRTNVGRGWVDRWSSARPGRCALARTEVMTENDRSDLYRVIWKRYSSPMTISQLSRGTGADSRP